MCVSFSTALLMASGLFTFFSSAPSFGTEAARLPDVQMREANLLKLLVSFSKATLFFLTQ